VVVIETERLLMRPLGTGDLEDYLELQGQPVAVEFLGPTSLQLARERLERCQRNWHERGHDLMAMIERSTGRFVGRTGLGYWPQFNETEVGWVLHRAAWGRGYATEAARAVVNWGFRTFPLPYITAMIRPDNGRSLAVARRLGLTAIRDDSVHGIPVIVHAVARQSWGAERRQDEIEGILAHVADWARGRPDLVAVALVGSRARGTPRPDSDVDLVFLSRDPGRYVDAEDWASELGGAAVVASAHRGVLLEQRLRMPSGLELDVAIGPPRWVASAPAAIGVRPIHDPQQILAPLTETVA
jgi:RimJ/RimL family protein N-acetyltransferase/predicted nucleotidyltransferase